MRPHRVTSWQAKATMWAGIAGSVFLLLMLLARGWGRDAWAVAAGALLITCIGVCVWVAVVGKRSARAVDDAVAQLARDRRLDRQRSEPTPPPHVT